MDRIDLDHNATTPLRPAVREFLAAHANEPRANPSSLHTRGRRARHLIDEARERVAAALGVSEEDVVFTSGGTESNNLAIFGVVGSACRVSMDRAAVGIVTTAAEHAAVLEPVHHLAQLGHPLEVVPVDSEGLPDPAALFEAAARSTTALVSVMAANNEVGALPDLAELGRLLATLEPARRPRLHVDAVQALGRIPVLLEAWGADLASFSAHKVGGPLGVGMLVRRGATTLEPQLFGGVQEGGLRPGTENAVAIAAASLAVEIAVAEREGFAQRTRELAEYLWDGIRALRPDARLLGPSFESGRRLCNTLTVGLPGEDGKLLVTRLDLEGLEVSAGSACASGSVEPSHVLTAMGLDETSARAGLRLTLGWNTTLAECKRAVEILGMVFFRRTQHAADTGACAQPSKRLHNRR